MHSLSRNLGVLLAQEISQNQSSADPKNRHLHLSVMPYSNIYQTYCLAVVTFSVFILVIHYARINPRRFQAKIREKMHSPYLNRILNMIGLQSQIHVRNLTPQQVKTGIEKGEILLVDIREPEETQKEKYPQAIEMPLSQFKPEDIDNQGKKVVFACRSGRRSIQASQLSQAAGFMYDAHLEGGLIAWKEKGFPTQS